MTAYIFLRRSSTIVRILAWGQRGKQARAKLIRDEALREREVRALNFLVRHEENKEIADHLGLSLSRTQKVLHSAFTKLGVRTRSEAIVLWEAR